MAQVDIFNNFKSLGIINDDTILALHDTNIHYPPVGAHQRDLYVKEEGGIAHQPVERKMVNYFKSEGYDIFSIKTKATDHDKSFPFRHGLTICSKFKTMAVP